MPVESTVKRKTIVRKITTGIPIRRVSGAAAQRLGDLIDVTISGVQDDDILQYHASSGLWKNERVISGGTY